MSLGRFRYKTELVTFCVKRHRNLFTNRYSEIQYYNWNKPGSSNTAGKNIGHFSQVRDHSSVVGRRGCFLNISEEYCMTIPPNFPSKKS